MLKLKYYGLSCFELETSGCKIVTDPFDEDEIGLKRPDFRADMVLTSFYQKKLLGDYTEIEASKARAKLKKEVLTIDEPGEYEVGQVFVRTYANPGFHMITQKDLNICYLGMLGSYKSADDIKDIGQVDYLIAPVGDEGSFVSWKQLSKLIKKIDPAYIIPTCYKQKGLKKTLGELKTVKEFLKEFGGGDPKPKTSLKMTSASRSDEDEQYKVIVMKKRK
jgi:L-ascorbate metabolism protein UlaG (beta-lactamase superfamily)